MRPIKTQFTLSQQFFRSQARTSNWSRERRRKERTATRTLRQIVRELVEAGYAAHAVEELADLRHRVPLNVRRLQA